MFYWKGECFKNDFKKSCFLNKKCFTGKVNVSKMIFLLPKKTFLKKTFTFLNDHLFLQETLYLKALGGKEFSPERDFFYR